MKEKQLLRDPDIEPTSEVIAEGLGSAYETYSEFINGLGEHGITLMEWRFYNDGKAWLSKGEYKWTTPRGANKVKPIFWLSIWEGFFRISFFFSTSVQNELQDLPVSQEMKELIDNVRPMGKSMRYIPLIIDIKNKPQLGDVYTIAMFRKTKEK